MYKTQANCLILVNNIPLIIFNTLYLTVIESFLKTVLITKEILLNKSKNCG